MLTLPVAARAVRELLDHNETQFPVNVYFEAHPLKRNHLVVLLVPTPVAPVGHLCLLVRGGVERLGVGGDVGVEFLGAAGHLSWGEGLRSCRNHVVAQVAAVWLQAHAIKFEVLAVELLVRVHVNHFCFN